jgi:DNA-directed RNA polymerase specialized sigma24 family protein
MPPPSDDAPQNGQREFPGTPWDLLRSARQLDAEGAAAVELLCRQYWQPVYQHLLARGCSPHDAEDLTQAFFQSQLRKGFFHTADEQRGQFPALIMLMVDRFRISHYRAGRAAKRGGGAFMDSLDETHSNMSSPTPLGDTRDPASIHLSGLARCLLEDARAQLRAGFQGAFGEDRSIALEPFIDPEDGPTPYAVLAKHFGVKENTLRLHMRRLRLKLGELLCEALGAGVVSAEEFEAEMRWFRAAMLDD